MVRLFSTEHTFSHPFSRVSSAFWRKYPNENAPHVQAIDCYERKIVHLNEDGTTSYDPPTASFLLSPSPSSPSHLSFSLSAPSSSFSTSSPLSASASTSSDSSALSSSDFPSPAAIPSSPVAVSVLNADALVPTAPSSSTPLLVSNRIISCETALPIWLNKLGVSNHAYAIETSVINPATREMVVKSRNVTGASLMVMEETCVYRANAMDERLTDYRQSAVITAFLPMFASKFEAFTLNSMSKKSAEGLQTIENLCQRIAREGIEAVL